MIIRIVRMTFEETKTDEFVEFFQRNKISIQAFPGCTHVELLKEVESKNVFTTYSHWESVEDLENYRRSELFDKVWMKTKSMFSDKPVAHSYLPHL